MIKIKTFFQYIFITLFLGMVSHYASAQSDTDQLDTQRKLFLNAEKLLKSNQWTKYQEAKEKLTQYPLYPHLVYKEIKHNIKLNKAKNVRLKDIVAFETTFPDFPFKQIPRKRWIKQKHKNKQWKKVASAITDTQNFKDTSTQCYYLNSLYQQTQNKKILSDMKRIWLVAHSQPSSCDLLFKAWSESGGLTSALIFQRFQLVMQTRNFTFARYLMRKLNKKDKILAKKWLRFNTTPDLIFKKSNINKAKLPDTILSEVLTTSVQHLARQNAGRALGWWKENKNTYAFDKAQIQRIQRDIGVFLSHQKHPDALKFLASVPEAQLDDVAKDWRVRMSIFEGDWQKALKWIQALPPENQTSEKWQYWKARAFDNLNQKQNAQKIYQKLATQRNYYGFLASMKLGRPPSFQNAKVLTDAATLKALHSAPIILRVEELLKINRPRIARIEWYYLTKDMSEVNLKHLAQLAFEKGWPDLSILTMTQSKHQDDLLLRFPLAHQEPIFHFSEKYQLDPAWIFALARQESAFFSFAQSPVGARGLMQLMPKTARYIANKSNIKYKSTYHLYRPDKNIELGTTYLKFLKTKWQNNTILATASYNAGPSRIKRWLPTRNMSADIWIDTIPYRETRHYVKNVVAFTGIYHQMLGKPLKLNTYMQPIHHKLQ
tara:strand:+ start:31792 stop:33768 length:1977 start_codon:yes stop_codon:yes gene_type:complete